MKLKNRSSRYEIKDLDLDIDASKVNKSKSAIPPLFNGPEMLSSASDKAKLFAENVSKNSNLNDSRIF